MEFLVNIKVMLPDSLSEQQRGQLQADEAARAKELTAEGHLIRMWRVIGRRENWGLWRAKDGTEMHAVLSSLPMFPYLEVQVTPLARHPADPMSDHQAA